ncbi:MAG: biotin/lipoate A/B protein ligase family protein [Anaerolineales bacterium]
MRDNWRLLITPAAQGAWNMAVDEAILEDAVQGKVPPTVRLYAWTPPCLSLGHSQPWEDVDLEALEREGWQVVRRPTGGRAILHTDELTYSVIGPATNPHLSGTVLESYRHLAEALIQALQLLGVNAQMSPLLSSSGQSHPPICFEVPSSYEITVGGKKLIGSAQSRRRGGVLQHGSLPLYGDLTRITRALRFADEAARQEAAERLRARATTLEEAAGKRIEWEEAAQAFVRAFEDVLNIHLSLAELTPSESQLAEALLRQKHTHPSWLQRLSPSPTDS